MEDKTKLTDENIEELVDTLSSNVNDDLQMLRELPSNQGVETSDSDDIKLEKINATMSINPNTGEISPLNLNEVRENSDVSILDLEDGADSNVSAIEITEDMVDKSGNFGDLSEEDSKALFDIIMRYKKGEKFSVYNAFPNSIKNIVWAFAEKSGGNKNSIAKLLLEEFISDIQLDKALIEFNDSIMKELKMFNVTDIYSEHRKEIMEIKLLEAADNIEAEFPEKAKLFRSVSATFTETYKMDALKNALSNRKNRQFIKNVENYEKVCRDFNIKYEKSKFKINNVLMIAPILTRKLPEGYNNEDIMRFVMLFCRECNLKDPDNILEHTFMYYTIQNILMLDYLSDNEFANEFTTELLSNICEVMDNIRKI